MEFVILAFEALKERKVRSILTILMVLIGAALLVSINGLSNGTNKYVNGEFHKFGTNMIVVTKRGADFDIKDWLVDDIKKIDGVVDVVPFIQTYATIYYQGETRTVFVTGIDQSKLTLIYPELKMQKGDIAPETDMSGILIGNQIANSFSNPVDVGQSMQMIYQYTDEQGNQEVKKKSFVIRGILEYYGSFVVPIDQVVFMPLKSADSFFNRKGKYDGLYVITANDDLNDEIADYIKNNWDVDTLTPQSIKRTVDNILNTLSFFMSSISFVSLLVASIGIITTLYTSMLERIREIGLLKAIGYKNHHILRMFLYEAALIGLIGGTFGIGGGVILAKIMKIVFFAEMPFLEPFFSVVNMVEVWFLSLVLSIISGLYPSWRASKLDPIVALKYE
ncbi:MAG: ABC transporter permease [Candidatus Njordarchaeia archaeon]